ncbi:MAG TPA: hypothetical protein PKV23_04965 [Aestuariivirga sp.]|nr:hypothetical protein [Aestuariivirga sp.]
MLADIATTRRQGHALLGGPPRHQAMVFLLVGTTFIEGFEATDTRLMFKALLRAHELPTPGILFAGTPRAASLDSHCCREQ